MPRSNKIKIGILTVSDRASKGIYRDISGKEILSLLKKYLAADWQSVYKIAPDNFVQIKNTLRKMADKEKCCLVITSGGTGPALRDITPEATAKVCHKMLPGFGEAMRAVSLKSVPTAILSRQTAGIRKKTLIINLPGNPNAIKECLMAVLPAVPDCIDLIGGPYLEYKSKNLRALHPHR